MVTINVTRNFILNLANGVQHEFTKGVVVVQKHVADHWMTKLHSVVISVDEDAEKIETEVKDAVKKVMGKKSKPAPITPAPETQESK